MSEPSYVLVLTEDQEKLNRAGIGFYPIQKLHVEEPAILKIDVPDGRDQQELIQRLRETLLRNVGLNQVLVCAGPVEYSIEALNFETLQRAYLLALFQPDRRTARASLAGLMRNLRSSAGYDETHLRCVCSILGISPDEVGFQFEDGRAAHRDYEPAEPVTEDSGNQ
jgi:hypothetical protein